MVACDSPVLFGAQRGGGSLSASSQEQEAHATRVLIVDDHLDTVEAMQMLLTRAGYDVRAACSAQEALSVAGEFTPDLAILDIRLPDMNGYELALHLRTGAEASGSCVRLIALSSCPAPSYELAARFDEIARKPITGAELQRLLRRFRPR